MTLTSTLRFLYIFCGSGLLCAAPENLTSDSKRAVQNNNTCPTIRLCKCNKIGHFACLCREFHVYKVKKSVLLFFKEKREMFLNF